VTDRWSTESRGSVQIDVRALWIKEPGQPLREGKAAHLGHLFVPVEHRGRSVSAGIIRDLRALLQSGALAAPLDSIDLVYGRAEPQLNRVCA